MLSQRKQIFFIDSITIDESDKINEINTSSACEYRLTDKVDIV